MKTAVNSIISEVVFNNTKIFYKEHIESLFPYCEESTIQKLKEDNSVLIDKLNVTKVTDVLLVAKYVSKTKEFPEEMQVSYLLSLSRLNNNWMQRLFNRNLYRKIINNIEFNSYNIDSIIALKDIRFYSIFIKSKPFISSSILKDDKVKLLYAMLEFLINESNYDKKSIKELRETIKFFLKNEPLNNLLELTLDNNEKYQKLLKEIANDYDR